MEQAQLSGTQTDKGELSHLHQQLQMREQLVDQLSTELFRVIRAHPPMLAPSASTPASDIGHPKNENNKEAGALRQELQRD